MAESVTKPAPRTDAMPAATRKAMQEGRALHNAALAKLTDSQRHAYKLCTSAITSIELVQRRMLAGGQVMPEFLQSLGTLQSYAVAML